MRLSLFFLMLILLPVTAGVHAWLFARHQIPRLVEDAVQRLRAAGVRDPVVVVNCLDIDIAGEAVDPVAHERALAVIREMGVVRLKPQADRIHVYASAKHELEGKTLRVSGWLPEEKDVHALTKLLTELRPDLSLDTAKLRHAPEVRWPLDYEPPLDAGDSFLAPLLDSLHLDAVLKIESHDDTVTLSGMLPVGGLREALVEAVVGAGGVPVVDPAALKASAHVHPAEFAKKEALAEFAASFFAAPPPRSFEIRDGVSPRITGAATRRLESEWLTLLRAVSGGAVVDAQLTLLPSVYHFPGYKVVSRLPAATLAQLRDLLRESAVVFEGGSRLPAQEQERLSALMPALIHAGSDLELILAAHTDPLAPDLEKEQRLARSRGEAVAAFLKNQGLSASALEIIVCDPVFSQASDAATTTAPRRVELLIK